MLLYALCFILGAKVMFISLVLLARIARTTPVRSPVQKLKMAETIVTTRTHQ
jgi:hypothetical protein